MVPTVSLGFLCISFASVFGLASSAFLRETGASRGVREAVRSRLATGRGERPHAIGPRSVPGVAPSDRYSVQMDDGVSSEELFTFYSISKLALSDAENCNGYFSHLENWTASWVNLEMRKTGGHYAAITLEVSKTYDNKVISNATIFPVSARNKASVVIREGKAIVTLNGPCQLYLDVDGQMEEVDTGPSYEGPPVHSFNIFANPQLLSGRPDPSSPDVRIVEAGEPIPEEFKEPMLYFSPGVHELNASSPYVLQSGKSYYFPIDAWVKGPLISLEDGQDIRLFGYGTLAGNDIERGQCKPNVSPEGLRVHKVLNMSIEGLTFVDFPNHHLVLGGGDDPEKMNFMSHVKVLGWRANGDGVHVCSNWRVQDLFLRTQDDSLYIASCAKSTSFTRVITWNDANGASFIFTSASGGEDASLTDSDAIYSRSSWAFWSGGRVFNLRSISDDQTIANISIDNIYASDPLPTMPFIDLNAAPKANSMLQVRGFSDYLAKDEHEHAVKPHHRKKRGNIKKKKSNDLNVFNVEGGPNTLTSERHILKQKGERAQQEEQEHEHEQEQENWQEETHEQEQSDELNRFSNGEAFTRLNLTERQMRNAREHMMYKPALEFKYRLGGLMTNVTFSNIVVRSTSTMREGAIGQTLTHGLVNRINTSAESKISNLAFNNVTICGKPMEEVISDKSYFYLDTVGISNLSVNGHLVTSEHVLSRSRGHRRLPNCCASLASSTLLAVAMILACLS